MLDLFIFDETEKFSVNFIRTLVLLKMSKIVLHNVQGVKKFCWAHTQAYFLSPQKGEQTFPNPAEQIFSSPEYDAQIYYLPSNN